MKAVPRHLLLRFLVLVAIVVTGFAVLRWTPLSQYLTVEKISALFDQLRGAWWAPAALILAYVVLCPVGVPASPMMIAGGIVFGPWWGSLYNVAGTFLGGTATYFLGRGLGRDLVRHLAGNKLKRVERVIARRGFWGMVGIRFLPIPYPLVNYTAALAGIRPVLFLTTTGIGLIPGVTIYTYFASLIPKAASGDRSGLVAQGIIASASLLLLTFIPQIWAARKRRERYRELCARRQGRGVVTPFPAPPPPPAGRSAAPHP
ncbi:MAG TPA: TVP38/TMEM64 family protein [Thermoanaerobaculia bacterium]|nr:TVP38/TMEM64 family protein [Thermoanaerobaculia bacterium]